MEMKPSFVFLALVLVGLVHVSSAQNSYVVLDSLGWIIPPGGPIAYTTWAANKTFKVGDILEFNFTTNQHDVAKVTKAAYDSCNGTNPIQLITTGPANVTLDAAGEHYFICTFGTHCSRGQKLDINVTGSSSSSPAPSPTPTTPASAPAPAATATPPASTPAPTNPPSPTPSRAPVTYTVGDTTGWNVFSGAAAYYASWASGKTFIVGDILVFNFANQTHDVAEVTKDAYDSCNTTSTLSLETNPPVRITLTTSGEHYYICTIPNHCSTGQKLAINVTGSSTATPPSSTATPPSSTATPPPTTTTPTGTNPAAPAPDDGSAKSIAATGLSATILSIAVALWI